MKADEASSHTQDRAFVTGCAKNSAPPGPKISDYLLQLEKSYAEFAASGSSQASRLAVSCIVEITEYVLDAGERDSMLYSVLLQLLTNHWRARQQSAIAMADLGYALQAEWEVRYLLLNAVREAEKARTLKSGLNLGLALGSMWNLRSGSIRNVGETVKSALRSLAPIAGAKVVSHGISSASVQIPREPASELPFAMALRADQFDSIVETAQLQQMGPRLVAIAGTVGVARGISMGVGRFAPHPLAKAGGFALAMGVGFWADHLAKQIARGYSVPFLRRGLESEVQAAAQNLAREVQRERGDLARTKNVIEGVHALLQAAAQLSALNDLTLGRPGQMPENHERVIAELRGTGAGYVAGRPSDQAIDFFARSMLERRYRSEGDSALDAQFAPADATPVEERLYRALERERNGFKNQSETLPEFLARRSREDARTEANALLAGNFLSGPDGIWVQVRALLKDLDQPFLELYVRNAVEPRIARVLAASSIAENSKGATP